MGYGKSAILTLVVLLATTVYTANAHAGPRQNKAKELLVRIDHQLDALSLWLGDVA